jgi:hypothetical protein
MADAQEVIGPDTARQGRRLPVALALLAALAGLALRPSRYEGRSETRLSDHARVAQPTHTVSSSRVSLARCRQRMGEGGDLIGLRRFVVDGEERYLIADPLSLSTSLVPASRLQVEEVSWPALRRAFDGTTYMKAVARSEQDAAAAQDAGIVHALPAERGVVLTVDLCPSRRGLDRALFEQLIQGFAGIERPVPVGIAVTGVWMREHPGDLDWLLERVTAGDLSVTWINHSYHHAFDPALPLSRDFLLMPGTDLDAEIRLTEVVMIERGMLPSVFFRFPGLVSDERVFEAVLSRGLIPTGSDAWLAKGQQAAAGSIVLVHGNGNEPVGVRDFLALMQRERAQIKSRHWLLFDLRQSAALP